VVVGLIALMGIEVKNSILLVDFTNQLRLEGKGDRWMKPSRRPAKFGLYRSCSPRSRLSAVSCPWPSRKIPLYSPLAYVLIGGLISSTLLSRIVTPVLYKLLAPRVG
jgi:hypothetical protein